MTFDSALQIEPSLKLYRKAWIELLQSAPNLSLDARATTLSLKVADKTALYQMLADNSANLEQIHIGTVNDRYIASAAMQQAYEGLEILKILERRPNSDDPLGLDSLDYLVSDLEETFQALTDAGLPVVRESNDVHAWLSLRFGDHEQFEAKFTDHLVLAVAIKELELSIDAILQAKKA